MTTQVEYFSLRMMFSNMKAAIKGSCFFGWYVASFTDDT